MVDLVIIGHLGINDESSPHGGIRAPGGAGYGSARGASVLDPSHVGLVASIGVDYDLHSLSLMGIDTRGLVVLNGPSAHFRVVQHSDGSRSFSADLGVASQTAPFKFPADYARAKHVHICSAPPNQQLQWIEFLGGIPGTRTVSVDAFEHYALNEPEKSRVALASCDLAFMNDEERRLLFGARPLPRVPTVLKHGSRGASYIDGCHVHRAPTHAVNAVDTTHAGEILAGVFLALRLASVDPATALSHAVRAATAKVTQFGVDGERLLKVLTEIRATVRHMRPAVL